jgi:hypothetical protein
MKLPVKYMFAKSCRGIIFFACFSYVKTTTTKTNKQNKTNKQIKTKPKKKKQTNKQKKYVKLFLAAIFSSSCV